MRTTSPSLDDSDLPLPYVIDPAITFRAASSAGNSNATTLTISRPSGVVQNDFLIAQVTVRGGSGTTITAPAGWTFLRREDNGTTLGQAIYHRVAAASEPTSYTWKFNENRTASGGIIAYSGVDTANPIDTSGGQIGSGNMVTAPSIFTTTTDTMLIGYFGMAHNATFTPPMGMTERYDVASTGAAMPDRTSSAGADEPRPMPGLTGPRTATATQSAAWVGQAVALRPAAAAPRSTETTVECDPEEFQAGGSTQCTATVTDTGPGAGSPPMGTVSWESDQTGAFAPNPCALVAAGAESSTCTVTYTSTVVGDHELTATYAGSLAHGGSSGSATVTVTPGPPAIVTVDPPTATNEIDTEHCVTATVTDAFGNPTPGVTVFFTVTGSNQASGTGTTDADGTTEKFCYTDASSART